MPPGRGMKRVADALQEPDDLGAARCGLPEDLDIEVRAAVVGCKERERAPTVVGVMVPPVVLRRVVEADGRQHTGRRRSTTWLES